MTLLEAGRDVVLVFEVADDGMLVFHNPSGDTPATQAAVPLPSELFRDFFAGRGVILWRPAALVTSAGER